MQRSNLTRAPLAPPPPAATPASLPLLPPALRNEGVTIRILLCSNATSHPPYSLHSPPLSIFSLDGRLHQRRPRQPGPLQGRL